MKKAFQERPKLCFYESKLQVLRNNKFVKFFSFETSDIEFFTKALIIEVITKAFFFEKKSQGFK